MSARSLVIGAMLLLAGCASNQPSAVAPQALPRDNAAVSASRDDDPELKDAIKKARESLDSFIQRLQHPQPREVFSVEAIFPAEDGSPQYLWLDTSGFKNGAFQGSITTHPKKATKVKYGDTVTVEKAKVTDWMILTSGKSEGGYTTDVLLRREGQPGR